MTDIAINAANLEFAVKVLSTTNWVGMLEALKSSSTETKIADGLITVKDAAEIIGVFFPPAAVVANDIEVGIEIAQIAMPLAIWLAHLPRPETTNVVWGGMVIPKKGLFQS